MDDSGVFVLKLPADDKNCHLLNPSQSFIFPLYIRGCKDGEQNLKFIFLYRSAVNFWLTQNDTDKTNFRMYKLKKKVKFIPVINLDYNISPSFSRLDEMILSAHITSVHENDILISQVMSASPKWRLEMIGSRYKFNNEWFKN